jgi:hypothetical protein
LLFLVTRICIAHAAFSVFLYGVEFGGPCLERCLAGGSLASFLVQTWYCASSESYNLYFCAVFSSTVLESLYCKHFCLFRLKNCSLHYSATQQPRRQRSKSSGTNMQVFPVVGPSLCNNSCRYTKYRHKSPSLGVMHADCTTTCHCASMLRLHRIPDSPLRLSNLAHIVLNELCHFYNAVSPD